MQYNLINKNNHIKKEELANLDLYYGNTLPNVYLDFLRYSNGYLFPNSSLIYSSFEIVERNITNEVNKYLNDYIAIGEGDGDKLYLMKKNISSKHVYIVDSCSIAMPDFEYEKTFDNFGTFVEFCQHDIHKDSNLKSSLYNIILIKAINDKKTIYRIKKEFNYSGDMSGLLSGCKNPPFEIRTEITYGLAKVLIKKVPELSNYIKMVKT